MSAADKVTFWAGKLFFFVIMFALPLLVFPWWQVLIGFLIVMLTVGLVMGVVFQLAHINGDAEFPEPVGSPPHIENEWAVHQVETTVDFAPRNRLLSLYIGGLNYQIEHHLLPHICHLNYPRLAPIVRATCEEFGIRYNCYPTWREAFACHWRELRLLGRAARTGARLTSGAWDRNPSQNITISMTMPGQEKRFVVLVEEGLPHGGLFELEQTTYHRVVDTRTRTVVLTFSGEMAASFSGTNGSWEDYHWSGVREVMIAPDEKSVIVQYFDGREETVVLEEQPMCALEMVADCRLLPDLPALVRRR